MGNHKRILVIDDDESIRNSLAAILRDEGYEVDVVSNGREALQKSEETIYNLALIDIKLPDMEGIDILIRMKDTVPKVRKIMMTGFPSVQNAIEAVNRKADAYLVKPVEVEKLLVTIREQLKLQENEKQYSEKKVAEFIETRVRELEKTAIS
jgi:two-component system nitrogen regulation response regulator NtrX